MFQNPSPNEKNQSVFRFRRVVSISSSNQQMHFFISLVFVLTVLSDFFLLFFLIGCNFFFRKHQYNFRVMPPDLFVETVFISFESMSSTIHGSAITFVTYSSNSMQLLNIFSRKLSKNTIVLLLMYLLVFLLFFCPLRTLPQTKSLM